MRRRMRAELDRSTGTRFDLKQGDGGLVDLEFTTQALLLQHAHAHPSLLLPRDTAGLVVAMRDLALMPAGDADRLLAAHALLLARSLDCSLDRRARLCDVDETLASARNAVRSAVQAAGLQFQSD